LGRQMTESLSLRCERTFLRDLCALTDARRIVAAADCRHCLSPPQHFLFHNKRKAHTHTHTRRREAPAALFAPAGMGLALFCGDRRTIAFYGHQPILSLTSLLSGCALHISDDFQQIRPRTMKVSCEQRFPSACTAPTMGIFQHERL
jgi:hypothetical protein